MVALAASPAATQPALPSTVLPPLETPTTTSATTATTSPPETTSTTGDPDPTPSAPLPPANPGPPLPPEGPTTVAPVPPSVPPEADDAGRRRTQAELDVSLLALQAAQQAELAMLSRLPAAQARVAEAEVRLAARGADAGRIGDQLAKARSRLRRLAVSSYVGGTVGPALRYLLSAHDAVDLARRLDIVGAAARVHRSTVATYGAAHAAASRELDDQAQALEAATAEYERVVSDVAAATSQVRMYAAQLENRRLLLDPASAVAPVGPTDVPRLLLDTYQKAALTMEQLAPTCRVRWTAVAGIGKVESNHAQRRGVVVALNGDVVPPIVGIPLDGTRGTRVITDTDGGLLDGDTVYDRAVGPMQFIPSTWKRMAQDGNGDARPDPNNVYDAALGTAAYLCRAVPGGSLDREDQLRRGLFAYNASQGYVEKVLSFVRGYELVADQLPLDPPAPT